MKITEEDLIYAAYNRCLCGAGLAHTRKTDPFSGYWDCSDILLGKAKTIDEPGYVRHVSQMPFILFEIKGEGQPSANGATTRPTNEAKSDAKE